MNLVCSCKHLFIQVRLRIVFGAQSALLYDNPFSLANSFSWKIAFRILSRFQLKGIATRSALMFTKVSCIIVRGKGVVPPAILLYDANKLLSTESLAAFEHHMLDLRCEKTCFSPGFIARTGAVPYLNVVTTGALWFQGG